MMNKFNLSAIIGLLIFAFNSPSIAQQELRVNLGDKITIPLKIKSDQVCNVELTIGAEKIQKLTEAPNYDINIEYQGKEVGVTEIKWEGKFRARGLYSVRGCSGTGMIKIATLPSAGQRKEDWSRFLSTLKQEQAECVRIGLRHRNIQIESIDPSANIESMDSPAAMEIYTKCDSFLAQPLAWRNESQDDFACTMSGGVETRCSGVYAEQTSDGKLRPIARDVAIQYHFDGKQWTTGQMETKQAKQLRERRIAEEKAKKEAEEIAKREAEEHERKWIKAKKEAEEIAKREAEERERKLKESPEYKKQQAELEKKRIAEQKAIEEKERKEQQQAELAARQRKLEEDKQKKEQEVREKKERMEFAKDFPYYAIVTCGLNDQHLNIIPCFSSNGGTELELKNGSEYNLYQVRDLMMNTVGSQTGEGFFINLRRSFHLKVQNADRRLILGVKIINRSTNETVFEKKVSQYGVIQVRN